MSLTTELREWAREQRTGNVLTCYPPKHEIHGVEEDVLAIADRIDKEHKLAIAYVDDRDPEMMAEHGWICLPLDADGVPIRVGDKMEFCAFDIEHPVIRTVDGIGKDVFFAWCGERGYQQHDAKRYRHYTPPTVEDVLLEACKAYHGLIVESMSDVAHDMLAPSEVIAEYAAKLQLKEGE